MTTQDEKGLREAYGWENPAPGTMLWRLRNHPDTLTLEDAITQAKALDARLMVALAATPAPERCPVHTFIALEDCDVHRAATPAPAGHEHTDACFQQPAGLDVLRAASEEAHIFGPDHERVPFDECGYEPCRQRRVRLAESREGEEG